jgi:hypothetical protein
MAVTGGLWVQGSLAAYFPQLAYLTPVALSGDRVLVVVDGRPSWPWILCGGSLTPLQVAD